MSDCINHVGATTDGYGAKKYKGKVYRAHRISYAIANSLCISALNGFVVMHSCDNRLCINPEHLSIGTHADNVRDKVSKNRHAKGESIGNSKLTNIQVKKINQLLSAGASNKKIAGIFRVSDMCISRIKRNITWQHL